jgi:SHAQKYF class myb-like DNA-binding protein
MDEEPDFSSLLEPIDGDTTDTQDAFPYDDDSNGDRKRKFEGLDTNSDTQQGGKRLPPVPALQNLAPENAAAAPPSGQQPWSEEMHRSFVEAVYSIGVSHASPSVLMQNMTLRADNREEGQPSPITSERVKSHLQKYRKSKEKSKDEFMTEYDSWMQKALSVGSTGSGNRFLTPAPAVLELITMGDSGMEGVGRRGSGTGDGGHLLGGDMAAFLTYSVLFEEEEEGRTDEAIQEQQPGLKTPLSPRAAVPYEKFSQYLAGARIPFPHLTEEEKKSSLGVSISHVIGLFYSMTHHLMTERRRRALQQQPESSEAAKPAASESFGAVEPTVGPGRQSFGYAQAQLGEGEHQKLPSLPRIDCTLPLAPQQQGQQQPFMYPQGEYSAVYNSTAMAFGGPLNAAGPAPKNEQGQQQQQQQQQQEGGTAQTGQPPQGSHDWGSM